MGRGIHKKEEEYMKCISCGVETACGTTTDVTDFNRCLVIVRNVPCYKCVECDETMYTGDVVKQLEKIVSNAGLALNEITVMDYNAKVA
jgi:YgiT-type zinc finger domain-containing protein